VTGAGHLHTRRADARRLAVGLGLVVAFMVVEVVAGVWSGSLALLADAGHMLADAGALAASLLAARLVLRPAGGVWTFGFHRAEVLSAAINGIALLIAAALVIFEAVRRLAHPGQVAGSAMIAVSLVGLAVNGLVAWVLGGAHRENPNVAASLKHVLTDVAAFAATLVAGVIVVATGARRADASASLLVAVLMIETGLRLLAGSGRVLLEAAPSDVDLATVRAHLLQAADVTDVHDLHVWTVTSDLPALSAHVVVNERCFREGRLPAVLDELQGCLSGHFDVAHSTFQLEPAGHVDHEPGTHA
jgi:cobalt-zinc-cadmium efflux system protein